MVNNSRRHRVNVGTKPPTSTRDSTLLVSRRHLQNTAHITNGGVNLALAGRQTASRLLLLIMVKVDTCLSTLDCGLLVVITPVRKAHVDVGHFYHNNGRRSGLQAVPIMVSRRTSSPLLEWGEGHCHG